MVQLNNVRMVYSSGTEALNGVSFKVDDGEFVFLVGPSGSGKTTIMKLITGEVSATSGRVIVNDFDMRKIKRRKLPQMRRTLGVIFQDFRLIDNMTVYDNVAFAMRVVGASNRQIRMCWNWSDWKEERSVFRTNSPAVSSSVWRSHARS